jgi:hypothetical protein
MGRDHHFHYHQANKYTIKVHHHVRTNSSDEEPLARCIQTLASLS